MALVRRFDTPGSLRDLPAGSGFYDAWHRTIDGLISTSSPLSGPGEYLDPSRIGLEAAVQRTYTWTGFPRPHLTVTARDDRSAAFAAGENRDAQHEYLEWRVTRAGHAATGPITKVTFVTETPEYWTALAAAAPDRVLELYRELVDPAVVMSDLFTRGGDYRPRNRWNTTDGIVHYVMSINSMSDLLGVSQEREPTGVALDNYDAVPYSRATAADARLNMDMWSLARKGLDVAAAEPVGIYLIDWDDAGWTKPDGTPVGDYWRVRRGVPGAALRVDYEVPAGEGFTVGDIRIGGRPITTGGQIAEHLVVSARGVAGKRAS